MQCILSAYVRGSRIVLQPITNLYVRVYSSHVYLLTDSALSLRSLKGLWKQFIPGSNSILKWQHTGAINIYAV